LYTYGREIKICAGPNTFADHLITLANGRNVLSDSVLPYPRVNIEEIVIRKPDVILVSPMASGDHTEYDTSFMDQWQGIPAVKNKRIHVIPDFVDRPSPRIAAALEVVAQMIHPDLNLSAGNRDGH
jgi:iron complex transport system substrate-binding protein